MQELLKNGNKIGKNEGSGKKTWKADRILFLQAKKGLMGRWVRR